MSSYEALGIASVCLLALAVVCALAAIHFGVSHHVVEVWKDVSGRRRRDDLAQLAQSQRQVARQPYLRDVAAASIPAQMQAVTLVADEQAQDDIATRIAVADQGEEQA